MERGVNPITLETMPERGSDDPTAVISTRKAAIVSISAGAITICLTFFVWDLGYVWYGTIGLAVALVLMYVVSKLTKDDPKDSEDFYEALDSGHRRFMRIKAKIK